MPPQSQVDLWLLFGLLLPNANAGGGTSLGVPIAVILALEVPTKGGEKLGDLRT